MAETASHHAADVIMSESFRVEALGDRRVGHFVHGGDIVGFSRTGSSVIYATVASRFNGLGWVVHAKMTEDDPTRLSSFSQLSEGFERLRIWSLLVVVGFLLLSITSFLLVSFLVLSCIRRLRTSIQMVADTCDTTPRGRLIVAPSPLPFRDIDPLVSRLRGTVVPDA